MRKNTLFIASALFSVLLLSVAAQAKAPETGVSGGEAVKAEAPLDTKRPVRPMRMFMKLSEAGQKILQGEMEKNEASNRAVFEELRLKKEEAAALLKAASFDKQAFLAKEGEAQALHAKLAQVHAQALANAAAQMTPEDRAQLAERPRPMKGAFGGEKGPHRGEGRGLPPVEDGATE